MAAWFLVTSGSTTTGVVAMATTVDRGEVLAASDLTIASITPDRALATDPRRHASTTSSGSVPPPTSPKAPSSLPPR